MDEARKDRPGHPDRTWEEASKATLEANRRRYAETTPGERIEEAFRLSDFAAELRQALLKEK